MFGLSNEPKIKLIRQNLPLYVLVSKLKNLTFYAILTYFCQILEKNYKNKKPSEKYLRVNNSPMPLKFY